MEVAKFVFKDDFEKYKPKGILTFMTNLDRKYPLENVAV